MASRVQIKDKDHGFKSLKRNLGRDHTARKVAVGVFGDAAVQENAIRQEFGLGVPERSFLRSWFDKNANRIRRDMKTVALRVLKGANKKSLLHALAVKYRNEVVDRIIGGKIKPKNAESTIRKKGFDLPLFEKGDLVSSIQATLDGKII